ncbi:MAG: hypothetical protein AB7O59_18915 [Pirellulales bacterium]
MKRLSWMLSGHLALAGLAICVQARAADVKVDREFAGRATWSVPSVETVRELAVAWLVGREVSETVRTQVETLWTSAADEQGDDYLLDLVVATLSAAEPRARELVAVCSQPRQAVALPDVAWLADAATEPFVVDNLRLVYGRWLVQQRLYDEAAEQLSALAPADVVDPAALLFYQAVVHHRTLARDPGLAAISRLMENESALPKRYTSVARLMQADLAGLKDDSLDHIARRMDDIRRRLDLGRAGPKVREVEDGVIASLDKMIEEMEKQQQAAAAAAARAAGRGGSPQPGTPLPDSRPVEQKGPGEVAGKPIGDKSGWGNLPPRERQEALQQISKEFPAHYRDMIEQYFRKLASDDEAKPDR